MVTTRYAIKEEGYADRGSITVDGTINVQPRRTKPVWRSETTACTLQESSIFHDTVAAGLWASGWRNMYGIHRRGTRIRGVETRGEARYKYGRAKLGECGAASWGVYKGTVLGCLEKFERVEGVGVVERWREVRSGEALGRIEDVAICR
jgi:hypothetical protein